MKFTRNMMRNCVIFGYSWCLTTRNWMSLNPKRKKLFHSKERNSRWLILVRKKCFGNMFLSSLTFNFIKFWMFENWQRCDLDNLFRNKHKNDEKKNMISRQKVTKTNRIRNRRRLFIFLVGYRIYWCVAVFTCSIYVLKFNFTIKKRMPAFGGWACPWQ